MLMLDRIGAEEKEGIAKRPPRLLACAVDCMVASFTETGKP